MKLNINIKIAFFFLLFSNFTFGQKTFLRLESNSDLKYKRRFQNTDQLDKYLNEKILDLKKKGFAEASVDSMFYRSDSAFAYLHIGNKYSWSKLEFDSIPYELISALYSKIKRIEGKAFYAPESRKIAKSILKHYENNGYPFAKVEIDSVLFGDYKVREKIILRKGPFIKLDSISIKGELKINPYVVHQIIGIKPGSVYSEKNVRSIKANLESRPYIQQLRSPEIFFSDNRNILFLYLDKRNSNRFSGILGFQNDPIEDKLMLTGDLTLSLNNILKQGEWISFNWNRFQNASQKLNLSTGFPFILKSPIGIAASLDLFKQDSTFIDVQLEGSILFSISRSSRAELSISSRQSNSLSSIPINSSEIANVSMVNYALGLEHNTLDYRPNPRKGLQAYTKLTLSNKSLENQQEGDSIYSDPIQYQAIIKLNYFIPTFTKQSLMLATNLGFIFNEQIFQNEMFRLGGLSTIRGFNEESIFASQYGVASVEYRYLYEKNANLRVFSDMAFVKNQGNSNEYNFIFGVGLGASLETKAGIFRIDYAMGKQSGQDLKLSDAKVHIAYVNNF